ncbi:MAG TPA: hypothetical protein VF174_00040 [Micromonosporaceae bacterium]
MADKSVWARVLGTVGLVGHVFLFFWYLASGLLAPLWAVIGLLAVWAALLGVGIRLMRTRPLLVLLVPVAAFLIWVVVISAGERWLGWTA